MESNRPCHIKCKFLKVGMDFVLGSSPPPFRESIQRWNRFSQGIDSVESMPESIKVKKFGLLMHNVLCMLHRAVVRSVSELIFVMKYPVSDT